MTRFAALLVVGTFVASASQTRSEVITTRPFAGVTHYKETRTLPEPLSLHVIKVDLGHEGISIRVTDPISPTSGLTTLQTTSQFVSSVGAQIGINANFFEIPNPLNGLADPVGLAASQGTIFSPFQSGMAAVAFTADNAAMFLDGMPSDPSAIVHAVAGFQRLIRNGQITGEGTDSARHPRSALGITAQNELLLVAVDGRNPGHSNGMNTVELAELLLSHGAIDAINLDGGSSTSLVLADGTSGLVRPVNIPSGFTLPGGLVLPPGTERPVGMNLAIFAAPIPEPGTCTLLVIGLGGLLVYGAVKRQRRGEDLFAA